MPEEMALLSAAIIYIAGFISGMWLPARYGVERLEGFGRWTLQKFLPYTPPPGKSEQEAMQDAQAAADDASAGDTSDNSGTADA